MTGTTEADKARARENRMKLIAANPDKRCPPEHKHGATGTCYSGHGCRCVPCRKSRSKSRRDYDHTTKQMKGRDVWVSAVLSRDRLRALGVVDVSGGEHCTVTEEDHFYSYRRDRITGRMATLIWMDESHLVEG